MDLVQRVYLFLLESWNVDDGSCWHNVVGELFIIYHHLCLLDF